MNTKVLIRTPGSARSAIRLRISTPLRDDTVAIFNVPSGHSDVGETIEGCTRAPEEGLRY